jgi:hypothetical protein
MIAWTVPGWALASAIAVLSRFVSDPDAEQNFQSDLGGKFGHLVQSVVDGVGADTLGNLGEVGEVFLDLLRADDQLLVQGRLVAAERCIGHAIELGCGIDRRARQRHRDGQPPPDRGNNA